MIELNRTRNNVVLSRRAVLEEERKEVRQRIIDRLQPGMVVEGKISNVVDFGAFVDLDGIDGLIHISELSWSHVRHPSEVLTIGDTVQVKVLDIDRDRQRISLGLKQTQEDPWQRMVDTYNLGDELEGKVTKVVPFGAFVEVLDGVEGLVHISELAPRHVENPREIVHPGDEIRVKILEIDSERRRLSLSAKRVEDQVLPVASRGRPGGRGRRRGRREASARGRRAGRGRRGRGHRAPSASSAEEAIQRRASHPAPRRASQRRVERPRPRHRTRSEGQAAEPAAEAAERPWPRPREAARPEPGGAGSPPSRGREQTEPARRSVARAAILQPAGEQAEGLRAEPGSARRSRRWQTGRQHAGRARGTGGAAATCR